MNLAIYGILCHHFYWGWTSCYDVMTIVTFAVLFVVFLILSKWYTLRERNREINIQAIVEEHYMRGTWTRRRSMRENMVLNLTLVYTKLWH